MTESDYSLSGSAPAPRSSGVTWGLRDIGIGTLLVLLLYVLLGTIIVGSAVSAYGKDSAQALLAQAATVMIWDAGMVAIVHWIVRSRGADWPSLGLQWPPASTLARLFGIAVGAYVASIVAVQVYGALVDLFGISALEPSRQIDRVFYSHTAALAVLGFAVVVTAPIAEEIFFRGFLFGGLDRRFGIVPAAVTSGLLFSLAHADAGLIIPFTLIGIILALTYRYSGSLFANIGVHFLFNLGSFLVLVFVPSAR